MDLIYGALTIILVIWIGPILLGEAVLSIQKLRDRVLPPSPEELAKRREELLKIDRERRALAEKNRIIGSVYLIARHDFTEPELWLAESDEAPYGLYEKFGWYRHKRSRTAGSSTHQFQRVVSDVPYDAGRHKLYTPIHAAKDERQVRLYRYDHTEFRPEEYDVYVVIDRVSKRISHYYVTADLVDEFLTRAKSDPFKQSMLAASNVRIPALARIDSLLSPYPLYRTGATP